MSYSDSVRVQREIRKRLDEQRVEREREALKEAAEPKDVREKSADAVSAKTKNMPSKPNGPKHQGPETAKGTPGTAAKTKVRFMPGQSAKNDAKGPESVQEKKGPSPKVRVRFMPKGKTSADTKGPESVGEKQGKAVSTATRNLPSKPAGSPKKGPESVKEKAGTKAKLESRSMKGYRASDQEKNVAGEMAKKGYKYFVKLEGEDRLQFFKTADEVGSFLREEFPNSKVEASGPISKLESRSMKESFMEKEVYEDYAFDVDSDFGRQVVPSDLTGNLGMREGETLTPEDEKFAQVVAGLSEYLEGEEGVFEITFRKGWLARMSAPGYMDATDWMIFDTEEEANAELDSLYGDDEEEEYEESCRRKKSLRESSTEKCRIADGGGRYYRAEMDDWTTAREAATVYADTTEFPDTIINGTLEIWRDGEDTRYYPTGSPDNTPEAAWAEWFDTGEYQRNIDDEEEDYEEGCKRSLHESRRPRRRPLRESVPGAEIIKTATVGDTEVILWKRKNGYGTHLRGVGDSPENWYSGHYFEAFGNSTLEDMKAAAEKDFDRRLSKLQWRPFGESRRPGKRSLKEGYTHYWEGKGRVFTKQQWAKICGAAEALIDSAEKEGIHICGGMGEGEPEITKEYISLNGDESAGEAHETFYLDRKPEAFSFCKTNEKPYDSVVVGILRQVQKIAPGILNLSSDGGSEVFGESRRPRRRKLSEAGSVVSKVETIEVEFDTYEELQKAFDGVKGENRISAKIVPGDKETLLFEVRARGTGEAADVVEDFLRRIGIEIAESLEEACKSKKKLVEAPEDEKDEEEEPDLSGAGDFEAEEETNFVPPEEGSPEGGEEGAPAEGGEDQLPTGEEEEPPADYEPDIDVAEPEVFAPEDSPREWQPGDTALFDYGEGPNQVKIADGDEDRPYRKEGQLWGDEKVPRTYYLVSFEDPQTGEVTEFYAASFLLK